jgi:hypothetical protein
MSAPQTFPELVTFIRNRIPIAPSERMTPAQFLRAADAQAEWHVRSLARDEDLYMQLGIRYHVLNFATRDPSTNRAFFPIALQKMKHAFEICTTQEYEARWSNRRMEVSLANEARKLCIANGPPDELKKRCRKVFDLMYKCFAIREQSDQAMTLLHKWTVDLSLPEPDLEEGEEQDTWALRIPFRRGGEWETYRKWVYALPQTQHMMSRCGQSLDEIAERMLVQFLEQTVEDKGTAASGPLHVMNPDPVPVAGSATSSSSLSEAEIQYRHSLREYLAQTVSLTNLRDETASLWEVMTPDERQEALDADAWLEPTSDDDPYESDGADSVS